MSIKQVWKANLYDSKLNYVFEFGKDVVQLLQPKAGEHILDLGCGTGELSNEIEKSGASVTGLDLSSDMIAKAKSKFPHIHFTMGNAEHFQFNQPFHAVLSNAALHWMKNPELVVSSIWNNLRSGGRFVAEFGGKGNVALITKAIYEVCSEDYGIEAHKRNPWYFPSIAEYSGILEKQGFQVTYANLFDRFTQLEDHEKGIYHWLNGFADAFVKDLSEEDKNRVFSKIAAKAKSELFRDGSWHIDYKRLRIVAYKV